MNTSSTKSNFTNLKDYKCLKVLEEVEMYNVYKWDSKIKACMCVNNGRFTFQNFRRTTEPFKQRRSGKRQQRNY